MTKRIPEDNIHVLVSLDLLESHSPVGSSPYGIYLYLFKITFPMRNQLEYENMHLLILVERYFESIFFGLILTLC
jgi:hypothetical protein